MRNLLQKIFLVISVNVIAYAQYPNILRHAPKLTSPITIPIIPSGTFAEPRLDHFHGGLDIKTQGVEGLPVIAPADGYVSRIKVAKNGYGQALYLIHNSGLTTVYGHLSKYNTKIQQYLRDMQYAKKTFEVDIIIPKSMLYVHKGDTIAYTGNTGSSGGPHLHFETRDTFSECPKNPQIFGISTKDLLAPEVTKVFLNIFDSSVYTGSRIDVPVYAQERKHNYYVTKQIEVPLGKLAVSVEAFDRHQRSLGNYNGIYKMILKKDNSTIFQYSADSFCFDQQRYVNAMFNYEKKLLKGIDEHYLFRLPGNMFANSYNSGSGIILNNLTGTYTLHIILEDYEKNKVSIAIPIKVIDKKFMDIYQSYSFKQAKIFKTNNASLTIQPNTFYDNYYISLSDSLIGNKAAILIKSFPYILPFHIPAELIIKSNDKTVEPSKMICNYINPKGNNSSMAAVQEQDSYKVYIKGTGIYYLEEDNQIPEIQYIDFDKNSNRWKFRVTDNGQLKSYDAYCDEQWILLQYDEKTNTMYYEADQYIKSGNHNLKIVVTDVNQNTSTFITQINF